MESGSQKGSSFLEYLVTKHRGLFATIVLLPLTVLFGLYHWFEYKIDFLLNSSPAKHDKKVRKVQQQIRDWTATGSDKRLCTARSGWKTMSDMVPKYKYTHHKVDVSLVDVLNIDEQTMTVKVEPMVNMGQLSRALHKKGYALAVLPELDDLTVGGLIMGFGIESSSHKYGLMQHICVSLDVVTADGSLIHCTADENKELFYSIPWSYGTLGFLVLAELKIVRAKRFVKIEYQPIQGFEELCARFRHASLSTENDFVEMLMYSHDSAVLMLGNFSDGNETDLKVNRIGRWYKPWFYAHAETFVVNMQAGAELIPLRHYYHRHTRSLFWEMNEIIPFGNHPIYRAIFGWMLPPQIQLLKYTETNTTRILRDRYHIVQDMLMPIETLEKSLEYFHTHFSVYPLWICPMAVFENKLNIGFVKPYSNAIGKTGEMYVDIGAYGTLQKQDKHAEEKLEELESFVIENGGYQALYAKTLMSEEKFRRMFHHEDYDRIRSALPLAKKAFDDVYDKVSKRGRSSPSTIRRLHRQIN